MSTAVIILLLLPLVGALISFGIKPSKYAYLGSLVCLFAAGTYAAYLLYIDYAATIAFEWLPAFQLGWQIDRLALLLILLVALIGVMVHVFSIAYMEKDAAKPRYFALLGFFCFSMIGLLLADHLILVFVFWELVGFSSYLLIGFWWQQDENAFAARYAFITNRIADVALFSGILWVMQSLGVASLSQIDGSLVLPFGMAMLLVIGAFGKSAQGPFFTWLPRAMAGPTPVSALIHAATMVAAGVYLLICLSDALPELVQIMVACVGAITALLAAIAALTNYDIKGVLAYSTISQLGFMVIGVGVGAPEAGFFHLWTHAFFKAGLFLSAGAVIHYMHYLGHHQDAQDMRAMGGIRKQLPVVFYGYTICMLALAGLPLFTGFLSKEGILLQAFDWSQGYQLGFLIPVTALITSALTAFYMMRQWLYVFFGQYRGAHLSYQFKASIFLRLPIVLLAVGSFFLWYTWNPLGHEFGLLSYVFPDIQYTASLQWLAPLSILLAVVGAAGAYYRYKGIRDRSQSPEEIREVYDRSRGGLLGLSYHAWYLDSFYTKMMSPTFIRICRYLFTLDKRWVDGFVNAVGILTVLISKVADLIDKLFVDGVVNLVAYLQEWVGNVIRLFHASRVQLHFFWAVILLVLVVIGFGLF